ncbi:hypothetical protein Q9L58_008812 [Maublancomyces gigas]|uniref:Uncharacterized protein n=1 Tax=Discina gigas TaxID=1032678 RepID=A0ABR3G9A6_9PEZI
MSSGFPTLQPAFKLIVDVSPANHIGTVASGSTLIHFPTSTGTLISVPGFAHEVNAKIIFGCDYLYMDPDASKMRVNVNGVAKTDDDVMISFKYFGTHYLTDEMKQALAGGTQTVTMPFGQSTTYLTFESGHEKYKDLENHTFVGNCRFIVVNGKVAVETRLSMVIPSTAMD